MNQAYGGDDLEPIVISNFMRPEELTVDQPPCLRWESLPKDEQVWGKSLNAYLQELCDACQNFLDAHTLVSFAESKIEVIGFGQHLFGNYWMIWQTMGVKASVVAVRNYLRILELMGTSYNKTAAWRVVLDTKGLRSIRSALKGRFPSIDRARDSIVHPELYADPGSPTPPLTEDDGYFRSWIGADGYVAIFKGAQVTVSLNVASRNFLIERHQEVMEIYQALADTQENP